MVTLIKNILLLFAGMILIICAPFLQLTLPSCSDGFLSRTALSSPCNTKLFITIFSIIGWFVVFKSIFFIQNSNQKIFHSGVKSYYILKAFLFFIVYVYGVSIFLKNSGDHLLLFHEGEWLSYISELGTEIHSPLLFIHGYIINIIPAKLTLETQYFVGKEIAFGRVFRLLLGALTYPLLLGLVDISFKLSRYSRDVQLISILTAAIALIIFNGQVFSVGDIGSTFKGTPVRDLPFVLMLIATLIILQFNQSAIYKQLLSMVFLSVIAVFSIYINILSLPFYLGLLFLASGINRFVTGKFPFIQIGAALLTYVFALQLTSVIFPELFLSTLQSVKYFYLNGKTIFPDQVDWLFKLGGLRWIAFFSDIYFQISIVIFGFLAYLFYNCDWRLFVLKTLKSEPALFFGSYLFIFNFIFITGTIKSNPGLAIIVMMGAASFVRYFYNLHLEKQKSFDVIPSFHLNANKKLQSIFIACLLLVSLNHIFDTLKAGAKLTMRKNESFVEDILNIKDLNLNIPITQNCFFSLESQNSLNFLTHKPSCTYPSFPIYGGMGVYENQMIKQLHERRPEVIHVSSYYNDHHYPSVYQLPKLSSYILSNYLPCTINKTIWLWKIYDSSVDSCNMSSFDAEWSSSSGSDPVFHDLSISKRSLPDGFSDSFVGLALVSNGGDFVSVAVGKVGEQVINARMPLAIGYSSDEKLKLKVFYSTHQTLTKYRINK